jgi:hypothetical protein
VSCDLCSWDRKFTGTGPRGVIGATGDPISQAKWDQVREGMSKEQVLKLMGEPDSYDGHDQIEYSRFLNMGWVEFFFDERDVLIEKNDESVFGSLR